MKALIGAFFEGTLAKGHCAACAVGNMIHYSHGVKPELIEHPRLKDGVTFKTNYPTNSRSGEEWLNCSIEHDMKLIAKIQISPTEYSLSEILKIEAQFEKNTQIVHSYMKAYTKEQIMEDQYKGLCAVVDVLCQLEGYDSEEYKKVFEYTPDFKQVNELV